MAVAMHHIVVEMSVFGRSVVRECFEPLVAGAQGRPSVYQKAQELHAGAAIWQTSPELITRTK